MNEVKANGGIHDINARFNTKMEGYTTRTSYIKELAEILGAIILKTLHYPLLGNKKEGD